MQLSFCFAGREGIEPSSLVLETNIIAIIPTTYVCLCLRPELHGFKWIFSPSHRLPLSHRLCWACWTRTNDLMNISHTISPTNLMPNILAGRERIEHSFKVLETSVITIIPTTYFESHVGFAPTNTGFADLPNSLLWQWNIYLGVIRESRP